MPNVKVYVDEALGPKSMERLRLALPILRDLICRELQVPASLAQIVIVSVSGLTDQALIAVELQILPRPERTRENLLDMCEKVRETLRVAADMSIAIRVQTVDPANYLVLR